MSPIAPPALVVTDGGSGFAKACKRIWPTTRVEGVGSFVYEVQSSITKESAQQ